MGFNVVHSAPVMDAAVLGQTIGQGSLAKERDKFWLQKNQVKFQQEQALRDFAERQRQFDANTALALNQQEQQQARYDQEFAARNAQAEAQLMSQEANRQAQLMGQQMGFENQFALREFDAAQAGADALDTQVKDFFSGARNMNLDPEGQRVIGEFVGKYRDIQANRGTMRPEQYQMVLGRLMGDMEAAGIDSFEIKQPTPWETMVQTHTPMNGQPMPVQPGQPLEEGWYNVQTGTRNGEATYEKRFIVDQRRGQFREGPNGQPGQMNAETGLWEPVEDNAKDIEGERIKAEGERKIKEQDLAHELFLKSIEMSMKALTVPASTDPVSGKQIPAKMPDMKDVLATAREIRGQLEAELGAFSNPGSPGPAPPVPGQPQPGQPPVPQQTPPQTQGAPAQAPAYRAADFPEVTHISQITAETKQFMSKGKYYVRKADGSWDEVQVQ